MAQIKEFKNKKSKRSFEAAQINRLNSSWNQFVRSINEDLRYELPVLRVRSNDLAQNDPLAKKYLNLVEENIVGSQGFQLQAKSYDSVGVDSEANNAIERHWSKWSKKKCDVRGTLTLPEIERLVARSVARDGEILIRHIFDDRNIYGYSLQLIEAAKLADINQEAFNGRKQIISGVEIDQFGSPIAYHIYKNKCTKGAETIRIPASEISHIFISEYPSQIRGIPWMSAVMQRMFVLKKFTEFALQASAIGASSMGFFTQGEGVTDPLTEEEDSEGELYTSAVGGSFSVLPPGYDFKSYDPAYPHELFDTFTTAIVRHIASGLGVSYNLLANDLTGVSYSSIRSAVLEERSHWMTLQESFISQMMDTVYEKWLSSALLNKSITLENGTFLPVSKKEKFMNYSFQSRRWAWVDPLRDINAKVVALQNKLESPYSIAAELGKDLETILDDIQRFEAECEKRGIKPQSVMDEMKILSQNVPSEVDEDE